MNTTIMEVQKGENINLLNESEWRMIHNALSYWQMRGFSTIGARQKIQQLMDKVRDNYITPYVQSKEQNE